MGHCNTSPIVYNSLKKGLLSFSQNLIKCCLRVGKTRKKRNKKKFECREGFFFFLLLLIVLLFGKLLG